MNIDAKKAAILAASFFLGGAAYAAITSGVGRRACVSLVSKGIKLKNGVACSLAVAKENVDDIIAEAKELSSEGCCCGCEEEGGSEA
jgi:predicted Fe-Mo cluster-binding NifX family protein